MSDLVEKVARELIVSKFGIEGLMMFDPIPADFPNRDEAVRKIEERLSQARKDARAAIRAVEADMRERAAGWQPIGTYLGHGAVLVSKPTDRLAYSATTAFLDVTNVWRVFRSKGGMTELPFTPTHWQPLPEPPLPLSDGRSEP